MATELYPMNTFATNYLRSRNTRIGDATNGDARFIDNRFMALSADDSLSATRASYITVMPTHVP